MYQYEQYELFRDVQMQQVFPDGKTIVDSRPKEPLPNLEALYLAQKHHEGFSLKEFVKEHFLAPAPLQQEYLVREGITVTDHIEALWKLLIRPATGGGGSKLALPFTYVVPGGRFGEMYYWDTYFTMLGLQVSGHKDVLEGIVDNFTHLIDVIGYIPNGTRDYFIGRSQPPYYSMMVRLLAAELDDTVLTRYLPQLEKEYAFWMKGATELTGNVSAAQHVVRMHGGELMNRYWDEHETPRPESYREDVELAENAEDEQQMYRDLRAGAESGWDFSSRWFREPMDFDTIHTTDIVPLDLNCLLWHLEQTIADAHAMAGNIDAQDKYATLATKRKAAIDRYCWDDAKGFYFDYDISEDSQTGHYTVAAATPLFFELAAEHQATLTAKVLEQRFLAAGGLLTTLYETGQQWDAPNGWAPLQWIAVKGLSNYGLHDLAETIAGRWVRLNQQVFARTGKLMEKYNVVNPALDAGGGEYEGQDGFGWTNGVLLRLLKDYPQNG